MARRVFFSFYYKDDVARAYQVRNSWLTHPDRESARFHDASLWEKVKTLGDNAIRGLINNGLKNTSVTAVLIGSETYRRRWVQYEVLRSLVKRKGLLGIKIHGNKDFVGEVTTPGPNPFDFLGIECGKAGILYKPVACRFWNWSHMSAECSWEYEKYLDNTYPLSRKILGFEGQIKTLSKVPIYDWNLDDGYHNLGDWVEHAAQKAGQYF